MHICLICTQFLINIFPLHTGFISNGEFNYLRSKGYTRPLSILQIRTEVRNVYNRMSQRELMNMLSPKGVICTVFLLFSLLIET